MRVVLIIVPALEHELAIESLGWVGVRMKGGFLDLFRMECTLQNGLGINSAFPDVMSSHRARPLRQLQTNQTLWTPAWSQNGLRRAEEYYVILLSSNVIYVLSLPCSFANKTSRAS